MHFVLFVVDTSQQWMWCSHKNYFIGHLINILFLYSNNAFLICNTVVLKFYVINYCTVQEHTSIIILIEEFSGMPRPLAISTVNAFLCSDTRYPCWYILVTDLCKILYLQKFDFEWSKRLKCQTRIFHWALATMSSTDVLLLLLQYSIYYSHSWGLSATLPINCVLIFFHQVVCRENSLLTHTIVYTKFDKNSQLTPSWRHVVNKVGNLQPVHFPQPRSQVFLTDFTMAAKKRSMLLKCTWHENSPRFFIIVFGRTLKIR